MAPHFLILVSEKRFRVLERFARPGQASSALREIVSQDIPSAAGAVRHLDAGRGAYLGGSAFSSSTITDEDRHRAIDWIAEHIERFLLARPGQTWAFAAGPSLNRPILDRLRPSLRGSLVESVHQDVSAASGSDLPGFFKIRF